MLCKFSQTLIVRRTPSKSKAEDSKYEFLKTEILHHVEGKLSQVFLTIKGYEVFSF